MLNWIFSESEFFNKLCSFQVLTQAYTYLQNGINIWQVSKCAGYAVTPDGKRNITELRDQQNETSIH